jgi:amino acid transporter
VTTAAAAGIFGTGLLDSLGIWKNQPAWSPMLLVGVVLALALLIATLGEEARNPTRDIPKAIMGVAIFGGVYFVVVTAAEMMSFGTSARGLAAPRTARKLGEALTAREGIAAEHGLLTGDGVAAGDGVTTAEA